MKLFFTQCKVGSTENLNVNNHFYYLAFGCPENASFKGPILNNFPPASVVSIAPLLQIASCAPGGRSQYRGYREASHLHIYLLFDSTCTHTLALVNHQEIPNLLHVNTYIDMFWVVLTKGRTQLKSFIAFLTALKASGFNRSKSKKRDGSIGWPN